MLLHSVFTVCSTVSVVLNDPNLRAPLLCIVNVCGHISISFRLTSDKRHARADPARPLGWPVHCALPKIFRHWSQSSQSLLVAPDGATKEAQVPYRNFQFRDLWAGGCAHGCHDQVRGQWVRDHVQWHCCGQLSGVIASQKKPSKLQFRVQSCSAG